MLFTETARSYKRKSKVDALGSLLRKLVQNDIQGR